MINEDELPNEFNSHNNKDVTNKSGGMSRADKQRRAANQERAKRNFNKKKFSRGITGRKTRNA